MHSFWYFFNNMECFSSFQSAFAVFLGDLLLGTAFDFSCFSKVLAIFQDKHAEIISIGANMIATYAKKVQGSLATQTMKVLNMPTHVSVSRFNCSIGSFLTGASVGGGGVDAIA